MESVYAQAFLEQALLDRLDYTVNLDPRPHKFAMMVKHVPNLVGCAVLCSNGDVWMREFSNDSLLEVLRITKPPGYSFAAWPLEEKEEEGGEVVYKVVYSSTRPNSRYSTYF